MINKLLPHGSRRRKFVGRQMGRLQHSRSWQFYRREYDGLRTEYYYNCSKKIIEATKNDPLISIVVPCFNTPERYIYELEDSIFAQGYDKWELLLVDGSSNDARRQAIEQSSHRDIRIRYIPIKNMGIAENTNVGIREAAGEYIAFLDHDDMLDPDALAENVIAIRKNKPDVIYSDEDKVSEDSRSFHSPHYKPDFSQAMLECVNYITHFVVVKKTLVKKVGFIETGYDGAQDFNFLLRLSEETGSIFHIPKILYHWRESANSTAADFDNKSHVRDAGVRALDNHFKRLGINAHAKPMKKTPGFYQTIFELQEDNKRAIIIAVPELTSKELLYMKSCFEKHRDVIKQNITCVIAADKKDARTIAMHFKTVLLITVPMQPLFMEDASISALFGRVEVGGYDAAAPKLISRGKITNLGYVKTNTGFLPLFYGSDPAKPQYFGSPNWNRDVNALDWGAVCARSDSIERYCNDSLITEGRFVVLGQYEYLEFKGREPEHSATIGVYYNPNLRTEMHPRLIEQQLIKYAVEEER